MRQKSLALICAVAMFGMSAPVQAQSPTDTVYNPNVVFSTMPRTYEIAEVKVEGADNYDDYIVIGY